VADPLTGTVVHPGPFGLGCAQLGNLFQAMSDDDAFDVLEAAWDAGVRWFDTAPHYGLGLSERRLGAFLRTKPRHEFTVSTKVGRLLVPNPAGRHRRDEEGFDVPATLRRVWDFSAPGVLRSLEASRERLGLDAIDVVLIHDPLEHAAAAIDEAYPALESLRADGRVRAIGVGTRDTTVLTRFVEETGINVVMLAGRYTLLDQTALDELFPACARRGVSVLNAGVFNSGVLASPEPSAGATFEYTTAAAGIVERARAIARVCADHGTSLPAAALAFSRAHPAIASIVVGAATAAQVRENRSMLDPPPPPEVWAALVEQHLLPAMFLRPTRAA
jgi:D-threo-aldose 1-dehydrogenase